MENNHKRYIVDSSVWIALFIDTDTGHDDAIRALEIISDDTIIIPYVVMSEVVTVLTMKHSFEQAAAFVEFLRQDPRIFLLPDNPEEEMDFFLLQRQLLSFVDITLIGLALKHGYHLVTFDQKMQKYYLKVLG